MGRERGRSRGWGSGAAAMRLVGNGLERNGRLEYIMSVGLKRKRACLVNALVPLGEIRRNRRKNSWVLRRTVNTRNIIILTGAKGK